MSSILIAKPNPISMSPDDVQARCLGGGKIGRCCIWFTGFGDNAMTAEFVH